MEKKQETYVSVVVPNYNHVQFLEQRLESIFNQSYQNFEVILLDDASIDGSSSILEKYSTHPKVSHLIINQKNSGSPFKQWKKGIELARGEFIWIAESDDFCEVSFLEEVIGLFEIDTVLSFCASINVNKTGDSLGLNLWAQNIHSKRWKRDFRNVGENEILKYLRYRNTIPNASAVIFRRKAISIEKLPEELNYCGDWFLWLEILKKGEVAYYAKPLNYFRKHDNTTRNLQSFPQEKNRFKEYFKLLKAHNSFIGRLKHIKKYDWIIEEWGWKKTSFSRFSTIKLGMPIEFLIRYWLK